MAVRPRKKGSRKDAAALPSTSPEQEESTSSLADGSHPPRAPDHSAEEQPSASSSTSKKSKKKKGETLLPSPDEEGAASSSAPAPAPKLTKEQLRKQQLRKQKHLKILEVQIEEGNEELATMKRMVLSAKLRARTEGLVYKGPELEDLIDDSSDEEEDPRGSSTSDDGMTDPSRLFLGKVKKTAPATSCCGGVQPPAKEGSTKSSLSLYQLGAMFLFATLLALLKMGEESFNLGGAKKLGVDDEDFYSLLGVGKSSSDSDLKKAYKKLALRWHPDKNPGCEECLKKFQKIGRAYETLGDKGKRQMYDQTASVDVESLPSVAETLTPQNYRHKVLASNEVWVIQTYTEADSSCKTFHPFWEEAATR